MFTDWAFLLAAISPDFWKRSISARSSFRAESRSARIANGGVQAGWVGAAVLVIFLVVLLWGLIRRISTTYSITNRRLTIRSGLLSREMHETRLERVQNVNSQQRLLERLLRVGTVDFDTAGGASYDFRFRGVDDPARIVRTVDKALHELRLTHPQV